MDYLINVSTADGRIDHDKAILVRNKIEADRALNFAVIDPKTCTHKLAYNKQDDDMHCHFCDVFLYRGDEV